MVHVSAAGPGALPLSQEEDQEQWCPMPVRICSVSVQVSRVAQAEVLLRESATWVDPEKLDEAIETALDNPSDLFLGGEPWHSSLEGVPEYVEGFEGPQVCFWFPVWLCFKAGCHASRRDVLGVCASGV